MARYAAIRLAAERYYNEPHQLKHTRIFHKRACRVTGHIDQFRDGIALPTSGNNVLVKATARRIHNHHDMVVLCT